VNRKGNPNRAYLEYLVTREIGHTHKHTTRTTNTRHDKNNTTNDHTKTGHPVKMRRGPGKNREGLLMSVNSPLLLAGEVPVEDEPPLGPSCWIFATEGIL